MLTVLDVKVRMKLFYPCKYYMGRGVATIYANTHLRTQLNRKYGIFQSDFLRFLDGTHTKCVWKSNFNLSNSILVGHYLL